MKKYHYKKIDAFTNGTSLGNPAAYIDLGADSLTESEMLKIAKEHQGFVSEVVFISRTNQLIKLAYYSSECEVSFCGHGTIATVYDLIINDKELLNKEELIIETNKKGKLTIINMVKNENAVFVTAPEPVYYDKQIDKIDIINAFDIIDATLLGSYPIEIIDAGLRTMVIPINNLENEISISPDKDKLEQFCLNNSIDIILLYSKETSNPKYYAHTRVFAPKYGYLEDPATGSGNSAFGYYLLKNNMWNGSIITIEQGSKKMVFNEIKLLTQNGKVLFGGQAKTKIEGTYFLD